MQTHQVHLKPSDRLYKTVLWEMIPLDLDIQMLALVVDIITCHDDIQAKKKHNSLKMEYQHILYLARIVH